MVDGPSRPTLRQLWRRILSAGFVSICPVVVRQAVSGFTDGERAALLRFVTSVPRPPLLGFKYLEPQLCIQARAHVVQVQCNGFARNSLSIMHAGVWRVRCLRRSFVTASILIALLLRLLSESS